jgi:hypothetical protein
MSHDLIDTTEMYLRTILELEEEGVPPLRARIAERLHQSGPTVSQTVARMERDGLVQVVETDRHLAKHRLEGEESRSEERGGRTHPTPGDAVKEVDPELKEKKIDQVPGRGFV